MNKQYIKTLILLLLLPAAGGFAQQTFNARSAAMGFSNGADLRGLDQVGHNPATLALPMIKGLEFNLISAGVTVRNNSFKKSQYDKYFTTGDLLSEADKEDIINSVNNKGLRADGLARVNTLAIAVPNFSVSLVGLGMGTLNIPKDLVDLPLFGNEGEGRVYSLDDANLNFWAGAGVLFSGAFALDNLKPEGWELLALGVTGKYIAGLGILDMEKGSGEFRDFNGAQVPYIGLEGEFELRTADGGQGFGFDLGGLAQINEHWTVGLTALNVVSGISWNNNPERVLWIIDQDSLQGFETIDDSVLVQVDTTEAIGSFTTRLPVVLDLAVAWQPNEKLMATAEFEQGVNNSMSGTTRTRFAMGVEYFPTPIFPLRAGLSFGGKLGPSLALGTGINLSTWFIDLAFVNHGQVLPGDFKGLSFSVTTRLRL